MILVASNAPLLRKSEAKVSGIFLKLEALSASDPATSQYMCKSKLC